MDEPAALTVAETETLAPAALFTAAGTGMGANDRGFAAPTPEPNTANEARGLPVGAPHTEVGASSRDLAGAAPPAADPQQAEATSTPYRSGGEAARTADLSAVRALVPDIGDRGLDAPAEAPVPIVDLGPRGTDTEFRSGGGGSRGEDTHEQPAQPRPRPGGPTRE